MPYKDKDLFYLASIKQFKCNVLILIQCVSHQFLMYNTALGCSVRPAPSCTVVHLVVFYCTQLYCTALRFCNAPSVLLYNATRFKLVIQNYFSAISILYVIMFQQKVFFNAISMYSVQFVCTLCNQYVLCAISIYWMQ